MTDRLRRCPACDVDRLARFVEDPTQIPRDEVRYEPVAGRRNGRLVVARPLDPSTFEAHHADRAELVRRLERLVAMVAASVRECGPESATGRLLAIALEIDRRESGADP